MLYSVVIPCYKSYEMIENVVLETKDWLEKLGKTPYEFVLVNDCSPDGGKTRATLRRLATSLNFVKMIDLAKNTGQHNAIMAGLNYAKGDFIICMDDDMQTHPSQLPKLLKEIDIGDYDVVYGYYPNKKHGFFRNLGSKFNALTVRIFIGGPKDLITSSYLVMRKHVRDSIVIYPHKYTYLRGLILRSTDSIKSIPVEHFKRATGQSGYTLKSLIRLWSNIIGFSIVPLKLATYSGFAFSILGAVGAMYILLRKLFVASTSIGWPSVMVAIFFFSGIVLMSLGLIGEYVGRLFLGHNKDPQYVIREIIE